MNCVHDGALMRKEVIEGVIVDRCPDCGGVWFDGGELEVLSNVLRLAADQGMPSRVVPRRPGAACSPVASMLRDWYVVTARNTATTSPTLSNRDRIRRDRGCCGISLVRPGRRDHAGAGTSQRRDPGPRLEPLGLEHPAR